MSVIFKTFPINQAFIPDWLSALHVERDNTTVYCILTPKIPASCTTRSGLPVTITHGSSGKYCLHGSIVENGVTKGCSWTQDGAFSISAHPYDLV